MLVNSSLTWPTGVLILDSTTSGMVCAQVHMCAGAFKSESQVGPAPLAHPGGDLVWEQRYNEESHYTQLSCQHKNMQPTLNAASSWFSIGSTASRKALRPELLNPVAKPPCAVAVCVSAAKRTVAKVGRTKLEVNFILNMALYSGKRGVCGSWCRHSSTIVWCCSITGHQKLLAEWSVLRGAQSPPKRTKSAAFLVKNRE